jgi:Holliday junction resolvase
VVRSLTDEGYVINAWNTAPPGPADIDATRGRTHILVQVRSAVYPKEPVNLTEEEAQRLRLRATIISATAVVATVQFSDASLEALTVPVLYTRLTVPE